MELSQGNRSAETESRVDVAMPRRAEATGAWLHRRAVAVARRAVVQGVVGDEEEMA